MSLKVSTGIPRHEVLMIDIGLQNCSDVNMIFGIPFTNRPLICQKYWSPLNCVLRFQQLANSRASSCYNYRARIMGMQCTYNTFGHAMRIQYFWTCDAHTILLDMQCTYNSFGHAMHIQYFWQRILKYTAMCGAMHVFVRFWPTLQTTDAIIVQIVQV